MDPELKQLFENTIAEGKVPALGAFLVNEKGEFLQKETFGRTNANDPNSAPLNADTLMAVASCTKLITSIAAIQLIEQGKLSPIDTVEQYVPEIGKLQVLESITEGEKPDAVLRSATRKPTIQNLLTHTSGLTYDFFDTPTMAWRTKTGRAPGQYYSIGEWADFETPFLAEPGTKFLYGTGIDWLSKVIQNITGKPFLEYLKEVILTPIGMTRSGAEIGADGLQVHMNIAGNLTALPSPGVPANPDVPGGGGFLCSSINDYARLFSTILNGGISPETGYQLLKSESVEKYLFTTGHSPEMDLSEVGYLGPGNAVLTNGATMLPTVPKEKLGWSMGGLLLNGEDLPYGRKAGSGAWAGMLNLYYWIDPKTKVAGMVMSSLFPFQHPAVLEMYDQFERCAYGYGLAAKGDKEGRNYKMGRV